MIVQTKKHNIYLYLIMIIISCLITKIQTAVQISDTPIQTTRHTSRAGLCSFSQIQFTQEEINKAKSSLQTYDYFTTSQIESLIYDKNFLQIKTPMIIQTAPHIIALIVVLILWIPLSCCCVWPEKHPVCKKCRKSDKQPYQRCQLKWTSYLTIIFYLIVIVGSILGLMTAINIIPHFNNVGCKFTAIGDDLLHGKISPTVQNRFFSGLKPFSSNVNTFKTNFNTIWTQSGNSLTTAGDVKLNQATFEIFVNNTFSTYVNQIYTGAFMNGDASSSITVPSQFKDMHLGPTEDSTKILGNIFRTTDVIFKQINAVLDPMIAAWGRLDATTQATVTTQMTTSQTFISSLVVKINVYIDDFYNFFNNAQIYNQATLGLRLLFGIFLGLSILGLIAAVLIAFCSVVRARLIMYFTCIGMYILSIISFALLISLSIIGPNLSQVCKYIDTKFSTGDGTKDFFMRLGYSQMADTIQNCMSDGKGWMINDIASTFNSSFADLLLITNSAQNFNLVIPAYSTANINAPITAGSAKVTNIINAGILQINDTDALNFLNALRLNALPNTNCDITRVNGDSWLASYNVSSCTGGKAQNNPCLNLSVLNTCPLGCYEIMNQLLSTAGDTSYSTNLQNRYGGNSACTYYNYVKNLHQNWNLKRKTNLDSLKAKITTVQNHATTYDTKFKDIQSRISGFKSILQTNYNPQTNLSVGAFNGMDCRVVGQSIMDLKNSICVGLLSSVNYNFIVFLLISYATLMVACCATCSGIRHFKHLQKMSIHTGYKGVPVSISSQRFFQKSA